MNFLKPILIFIFLFSFCKEPKKNPIPLISESNKHSEFFLDYANLVQFSENSEFPNLGISLIKKESKTCIYSNSSYFLSKEYGPKFGICFENSEINKSNLNLIFNSVEKTFGNLEYDSKNVEFETKTKTELVSEISEQENAILFFGDEELELELKEKTNKIYSNSFSLSGHSGTKLESSFSISYFSLLKVGKSVKIIFPLGKNYLVLDLSNIETSEKIIQDFFNSIDSIHQKLISTCSKSEIKFTEIFLGDNEFIEWKNDSNQILCISDFSIKVEEEIFLFKHPSKFYFPDSVKILFENSSISKNFPNSKNFWSKLKSSSKVFFLAKDIQKEILIPRNFVTSSESILQSYKPIENLCEFETSFKLNHCFDPGIELELDEKFYSQICDINNFTLTEINPFGIIEKDKVKLEGKFLELEYLGKISCEFSRIRLQIGSRRFYLNLNEKISPSAILVIGKKDFYKNLPNLVSIDLDSLSLRQKIDLLQRRKQKNLFQAISEFSEYSFLDKNKNVYSIHIEENKILFHAKFISKFLNPFFQKNHFFSPGEKNPISENSVNLNLNEIHWAGSYRGTVSITDDDFLEFLVSGKGMSEISIQNRKFFFPIDEKDEILVLSENALTCFPDSKTINLKNFSLKDEFTKIKFYSNGIEKEFDYDPKKNQGLNLTSERKRYSYVKTKDDIWKNSNEKSLNPDPLCFGKVFASPNLPNEFNSFLFETTEGLELISPDSEKFLNFEIKQTTFLPNQELISPLLKNPYSNFVNFNFLNLNHSLVYVELIPGSENHLFNRDGIFIEGVLPSPSSEQNEWVLICNRGTVTKDLSKYEIHDESSIDELVSFQARKGFSLPSGLSPTSFIGNSTMLQTNSCAYILDPDVSFIELQKFNSAPNLILTVKTSSTIGNGISSSERLDLFLNESGSKFHIHSYGNRYSPKPFSISLLSNQYSLLKKNHKGESSSDYEVKE